MVSAACRHGEEYKPENQLANLTGDENCSRQPWRCCLFDKVAGAADTEDRTTVKLSVYVCFFVISLGIKVSSEESGEINLLFKHVKFGKYVELRRKV